jgi:hypothetical protein
MSYVQYFQLLKYFLFLFFSSEQLCYQNRSYRKKDMWILCRSQCFSNLHPPTSGPNFTPFILLGLSARECAQQTAHTIRNETKYSSAHSELQWRNPSPGCIKHEENSECINCWAQWTFSALNSTLCLSWLLIYFFDEHNMLQKMTPMSV